MLTGKQFRLNNPTLALELIEDRRVAFTIPRGAVIEVASGPDSRGVDATLSALWESKKVTMFAMDVLARGTEIDTVVHDKGASVSAD